MPTVISGPRQARSYVTPAGAQVVTRVLDFNFASDQGIEIDAVLGMVGAHDSDPTPSDTAVVGVRVAHSLHLEEGTIEDVPIGDGDDADEIDSEVFFQQQAQGAFQTGTTNTFGAGGSSAQGMLYVPFKKPVLVARNITHRGETLGTGQLGWGMVTLYYHYVRFSISELGLILSRRQ